jgi:hypothetical protein
MSTDYKTSKCFELKKRSVYFEAEGQVLFWPQQSFQAEAEEFQTCV